MHPSHVHIHAQAFSACDSTITVHSLPKDHWTTDVTAAAETPFRGKAVPGFWVDLIVLLVHPALPHFKVCLLT